MPDALVPGLLARTVEDDEMAFVHRVCRMSAQRIRGVGASTVGNRRSYAWGCNEDMKYAMEMLPYAKRS